MKRLLPLLLGCLALGVEARAAESCAGCSNPNLPVGRAGLRMLSPGQWSASAATVWTAVHVVHESACPDIGPICAERDEPPQLHDQRIYVGEFRLAVEYGLLKALSVEAQLPLRISKTTIAFRDLDGMLYVPDYVNIHHRNETLVGIGDPWLSVRTATTFLDFAIAARLGVTLPLGGTEPNPFALGDMGLSHQHIQFGTGTFNLVLGLDVARTFSRYNVYAYAQSQVSLYENRRGYRAGNRLATGLGGGARLFGQLRGGVDFDVLHEAAERWDGEVLQDGNLGRTDVLIGGTLSYLLAGFGLSLSVKVPVYQRIIQHHDDHGRLTYPAIVMLGVQRTLGGAR